MRNFLDKKHGPFIGRVYMLVVLLLGNALMILGAALFLNPDFGWNAAMMIVGLVITVATIAVLSTPADPNGADEAKAE